MEPLSNILKVLFLRDSNEILDSAFKSEKRFYADRCINKDHLAHQLLYTGLYSTLDQALNEADLLTDKWMQRDEDYHMLRFSKEPSVFNTLLHFSASRLRLKDGQPICNYDQLLSWDELTKVLGEDLFVTSYLASRDIAERRQMARDFNWDICLKNDAGDLAAITEQPMVDVHAHLKGSSANFEISWICLMNHISKRTLEFKELSKKKLMPDVVSDYKERSSSLYSKIIKAAAIRLYLFLHINQSKHKENHSQITLQRIIQSKGIETFFYLDKLQDILDLVNAIVDDKSGNTGLVSDYAVPEIGKYVISQIGGERKFLYQNFKAIYLGQYKGRDSKLSTLFYCYLVAKEELRKEINQVNQSLGFANFEEYQNRKSVFLWYYPEYENLMIQMAVSNYMDHSKVGFKYMEPRIAPMTTATTLNKVIYNQDNAIRRQFFTTDNTLNWNYDYVCHFIKLADKSFLLYNEVLDFIPRHYQLRETVKKQAIALYDLRTKGYLSAKRIVGIDAANSEIACRPEVFAHAFRFLKAHKFPANSNCIDIKLPDLGRTYHVGEDFYSIVDGLRAVEEVFKFLHWGNGDRFGHALVLGTDVERYYARRHYCINAKVQVIVDNLAWLYVKACRCGCSSAIAQYLKDNYRKICYILYDHTCKEIPDINDYYQAWLLRGDEPELYKTTYHNNNSFEEIEWQNKKHETISSVSMWESSSLNYGYEFEDARNNWKARNIYHDYHYNSAIKKNGNQAYLLKIDKEIRGEFMSSVIKVQQALLNQVEKCHIAIECNPSSNLKIGDFDRYDEHPITRFNNIGLITPYERHDISVSINTDDSGVFSTTLEREYSLIALSLEKCRKEGFDNSPRTILHWIDTIRLMGHEQKFSKDEVVNNNLCPITLSNIDKESIFYFKNKERSLVIRL